MFIANDIFHNRIDARNAERESKYFCPICGNEVRLKKGEIYAPHFAHINGTCSDTWNYDMSWWHRTFQDYFPLECQEIIVKCGRRKHRADVLIDDIVIEIQHSPISISEFNERNNFFKEAGYRLAWIFDLSEQYASENIYYQENRGQDYLMHWKHPKKIFSDIPYLNDNNKRFVLWFAYNASEDNPDVYQLDKIIWSPINEYGERIFNKFIVSQYMKVMYSGFAPQQLFNTKEDNFKQILRKANEKYSFNVKISGDKGHLPEEYTCKRTNKFGIKVFSEAGCIYCRYCYMVLHKKRENQSKWAVYCTFPVQCREPIDDTYDDYECNRADIYSI
jgi:hypothetical protein